MTSKRRPTLNTASSKSKLEAHSHITARVKITPNELIVKKYYLPVLQEEERHNAFLISRFISGIRTEDRLGLGELQKMHGRQELLVKCYEKSQTLVKYEVSSQLASESEQASTRRVLMHFQGFAFYLLLENQRMLRQHTAKKSFTKKETSRSTKQSAKREGNILKQVKKDSKINESHQLTKLSKCLKGVLRKHENKNYKTFLEEMQRRKNDLSLNQPARMMDLINNLQKDISSIHQETPQFQDYSKESIYGLSDLKKKSQRNPSKMQPNPKDKRLSTKFTLCKMQFIRKPKDLQSAKANSQSKNSGKSTSLRNKKCSKTNTSSTPDHHNSKSKSRNDKKCLKTTTEVKKKLIDTQKLYFDDTPEEKQQSKNSLLRSCLRKPQPQPTRSKKKPLKR